MNSLVGRMTCDLESVGDRVVTCVVQGSLFRVGLSPVLR